MIRYGFLVAFVTGVVTAFLAQVTAWYVGGAMGGAFAWGLGALCVVLIYDVFTPRLEVSADA